MVNKFDGRFGKPGIVTLDSLDAVSSANDLGNELIMELQLGYGTVTADNILGLLDKHTLAISAYDLFAKREEIAGMVTEASWPMDDEHVTKLVGMMETLISDSETAALMLDEDGAAKMAEIGTKLGKVG